MKNFKKWIILIFLICIYTFFCAYSYVQAISNDLKDSVFRLHVIANSDSSEDQALKYKVRDNILNYMKTISFNCSTKEEAIKTVNQHMDDFKKIAQDTIVSEGFTYDVQIEIGEFEFPSKSYGDISLPAGIYDALRIKIGNANGHNWWCVMFPPLCFVDITSGIVPESSKQELKNQLTDEEFTLISNASDSDINFKFKLLEFFTNSDLLTAKN
ncbi:MAG: stage II sporulation protein R [Clostridia bacterium]|nr:stage II sporulation protein R [Clostridia bacterium]